MVSCIVVDGCTTSSAHSRACDVEYETELMGWGVVVVVILYLQISQLSLVSNSTLATVEILLLGRQIHVLITIITRGRGS